VSPDGLVGRVCAGRRTVWVSARLPPAILNEVLMRRIGFVILALSLVLALRAVEAQQALRELDDALAGIRC
jgi:hypothetical protein